MKKIFLMLAAAGMLFSSCQKDENLGGSAGETLVTVTASVPQAVGTRAAMNSTSDKGGVVNVDDSKYDLRFVLRIYEGDKVVKEETWAGSTKTLEYQKQYRLVPGHNYKFVVWADFVKEGTTADLYYSTSDFAAVSELEIPEGETRINNEARDAYFVAQDENNLAENASVSLTLKRPFGKVRVVTTDWNEDAVQVAAPDKVKITYNNTTLYTGMNLLTGELSGENTQMEYTADINDYTNEGEGAAEKTLYVDYLWGKTIANPDTATASTVEQYAIHFTIDAGIRTYDVKTNVPISRNWLTTVKGNILTTNTNVNINVDPEFDGFYGDTLLQLAAISGGEVTLTENVVLTEPLNVTADLIINLGDYTISNANGYAIENSANLTINGNNGGISGLGGIRSKGGKITINGGTYTASSDWNNSTYQHILKAENTEVVINNGTFDATIGGITNAMINVANGSKVTINGGEFKNVNGEIPQFAPYMFTYEGNGKLIINDGDFYGGWRFNGTTATTDIYDGNFTISYDGQSFHANSTHVLTIYGGTFSTLNGGKLNPSSYVATGYNAIESNGTWYVVTDEIDAIIAVTPENIGTTTFDADNTIYKFEGSYTNGITFKAEAGKNQIFDGSAATIEGPVKFTASRIADSAVEITGEKSGNYVITGFSTSNSISVGTCAVALSIENCKAYMMYLNVTNTDVTLSNNTIVRPATAEDTYSRYDGGTQKDIIQIYAENYSVKLKNNTIKDEKGVGNNIEIYGQNSWQSNATWTNSIVAEGNTISNASNSLPLVKIYNDVTFAPVTYPADYVIPEATKTLARQFVNGNTLTGGSCAVEILCRAAGKSDANIAVDGNE